VTNTHIDEQLIRLASDEASVYRDAWRWFLAQGSPIATPLAQALDNERLGSVGHWRILLVLRELAVPSTLPAIVTAFRRALAQNNPIVLPGAMEALAAFDSDDALSALIAALDAPDPDTVNHAAALLARKGGRRAEDAVATLLNREAVAIRQAAVSALLKVDSESAREILRRHRSREIHPAVLKLLSGLR
jgi:HEAT repeat protein